jgi:hypothetical protein
MLAMFRNFVVKQAALKILARVIETYVWHFTEYATFRYLIKITPIATLLFDTDFPCFISCINNGKNSITSVGDSIPLINAQNTRLN